jgi:hypothetical protein
LALRLTHLLVGVAVQTLRGTLLASRLSYCTEVVSTETKGLIDSTTKRRSP